MAYRYLQTAVVWPACVLAWILFSSSLPAQDVRLDWNLSIDDQLRLDLTHSIVQTSLKGDFESQLDLEIELDWQIVSVETDQPIEILQQIKQVRFKIDAPNVAIEYDSNSPDQPGVPAAVRDAMRAAVQRETTLFMSRDGGLGLDSEPADAAAAEDEPAGPPAEFGERMSDRQILNLLQQLIPRRPSESAAQDAWTYQVSGASPQVEMTMHCMIHEPSRKESQIQINLRPQLILQESDTEPADFEIVAQRGGGAAQFDRQLGLLTTSRLDHRMEVANPQGVYRIDLTTHLTIQKNADQ